MKRWQKYELIALDEVGQISLADIDAEFLFQVISERAERAAIIVTTNLPFQSGPRCFQVLGSVKRCSMGSQIDLTSSKLEQNHFASGARWKGAKKRRVENQTHNNRQWK